MSNLIPAQPNTRFHFKWSTIDGTCISESLPVVGYSESDVLLLHLCRTVWASDLADFYRRDNGLNVVPLEEEGYFTIDGKDTIEPGFWPEVPDGPLA